MTRKHLIFLLLAAGPSLAVAQSLPPLPMSPAPVAKIEYDPNGNTTGRILAPTTPGFAFGTFHGYDKLGRRETTTDARNGVTHFGYNGRSDLAFVLDPRALPTEYLLNGLGDAGQVTSPDTGVTVLTYDSAGNVATALDARGVLATYGYDALNRLTSIVYSQSGQTSVTYGWAYDEVSGSILNGIGRLTSTTFPDGSSQHSYDAQGRLKTFTQTVNAKSGANLAARTHVVTYGYDANGNVQEIIYPSGRKLTISYSNGLPTSMSLANNVAASPVSLVSGIVFEPFGAAKRWNWELSGGAQRPHERHYDEFGRAIRYTLGGHVRDVRYDEGDRISRYTHYSAIDGAPAASLDQAFDYDELGRLTSIGTAAANWGITYDPNGNRQSVTLNGSSRTYTTAETSNRLSRLNNPLKLFGYDATGNQTSGGFVATYGLNGRMATLASGGVTATYSINGSGQRIRKFDSTGGASTVIFVYDQAGHLFGEYDRSGDAIREYIWLGDELIAAFAPAPGFPSLAAAYFVHTDHLGAPRAVLDRSDQLRWRWLAEPFGTTPPETNPAGLGEFALNLRLPGQYFDNESGLHYNHHRDYDRTIGRYVQSDPIGLAGGINTYVYVGGNPVSYVDPNGLQADDRSTAPGLGLPNIVGAANRNISRQLQRLLDDICRPDCSALEAEIRLIAAEIRERYFAMLGDPRDLFKKATIVRISRRGGSWVGHRQQFRDKQTTLRKKIDQADAAGCVVDPMDRVLANIAEPPDTPAARP